MYTDDTIKEAVRSHIAAKCGTDRGSYKAYARVIDVNQMELSSIVNGYRRPSDKLLADMGLQKIIAYVPRESK